MHQGNKCPHCSSPIKYGHHFCRICGKSLIADCPSCGSAFSPGAITCPNCGASPDISSNQQSNCNTQQQRWNIQQLSRRWQQWWWGSISSTSQRQLGWASSAIARRLLSTRSLLIIMLLVVIIVLGGVIFWQLSPKADKTAPIISGIYVTQVGKISARIIWQTDKPCSSQVEYGRTTQYGSLAPSIPQNDPSTGNVAGVTLHSVNLTNLKSKSTYHYRVRSKDVAGNEAISSDFWFKTEEVTPFVLPE